MQMVSRELKTSELNKEKETEEDCVNLLKSFRFLSADAH